MGSLPLGTGELHYIFTHFAFYEKGVPIEGEDLRMLY
jgi:hypothetical protein